MVGDRWKMRVLNVPRNKPVNQGRAIKKVDGREMNKKWKSQNGERRIDEEGSRKKKQKRKRKRSEEYETD